MTAAAAAAAAVHAPCASMMRQRISAYLRMADDPQVATSDKPSKFPSCLVCPSPATFTTITLLSFHSSGGQGSDKRICSFCDKPGHTAEKCYFNPKNPSNKLSNKMLERLMISSDVTDGNDGSGGFQSEVRGPQHSQQSKSNSSGKVEFACISVKSNKLFSYIDSGATIHVFQDPSIFVPNTLKPCSSREIALADESVVKSTYVGQVVIPFRDANLRITEAYLVPDLGFNLVSVGKLADAGIRTTFEKECVRLLCNDSDQRIGTGIRDKSTGLYMLPSPQVKSHQSPRSPSRQEMSLAVSESHEASLWHRRLAHVNMQDLGRVHAHTDGVPKISASSCKNDVCRACRLGKAHKLPFKGHFVRATRPGEIVHSDIVGPLPVSYPQRHRYLVTFLDDYSRHVFVAFMRHKSDVKQAFQEYRAHVEASVDDIPDAMDVHTTSKEVARHAGNGFKVVRLHSDNAQEYKSILNMDSHGDSTSGVEFATAISNTAQGDMEHTYPPPYTPELNSIAERVNRTIVEPARCMLIQAGLPTSLWPFAVANVVQVRNRMLHSTTKATPHQLLTGQRPSLKYMRVFGCAAYVLRQPEQSKLDARGLEGVLLQSGQHGVYEVLVWEGNASSSPGNVSLPPRIVRSRHVTFDESRYPGISNLEELWDEEEAWDDSVDSSDFDSEEEEDSEGNYADDESVSTFEDSLHSEGSSRD